MPRWSLGLTVIGCMISSLIIPATVGAEHPPSAAPPLHHQFAQLRTEPPATRPKVERLDALFARLKTTKDETEADALVAGIWEQWLQSGREDIDILVRDAMSRMNVLDFGIAMMVLDEVVAKAPDYAEGWNKRATLLYMMGDLERSLADIERTLKLEPRHFGALAGRGLIGMQKGDWKMALAAFRAALKENPFLEERHQLIPALEKKVEGDPT